MNENVGFALKVKGFSGRLAFVLCIQLYQEVGPKILLVHRRKSMGALLHDPYHAPQGSGERRYFTPSRSMSNINVAPGGMTPPAPLAP
jgi:hypothetical protein